MLATARIRHGMGAVLVGGGLLLGTVPAATVTAASGTGGLTAPNNLHAVTITDQDIVLAWNASTSKRAVFYDLLFDDNPNPFGPLSDNQFDVHLNRSLGMIPGSSHTFQVRAGDTAGHTAFSNTLTVSFASGDNTPPTAPGNLHVVNISSAGVELAWDASIDESDVTYFVDGSPCSPLQTPNTDIVVPSIDRDPVCGLTPGFTYSFAVRARDALDNDSAFSNTATVDFSPNQ